MEISYANRRIEKICTDEKAARKELGHDGAKVLRKRLDQMRYVESLEDLRLQAKVLRKRLDQMRYVESLEDLRLQVGGWHELVGDRKGELACSLTKLKRLVFMPANDPIPTKPDGGLDWSKTTAVMNIEIVDYH